MTVQEIKKKVVPTLKLHHVKRAAIFGSAAQGKMKESSDVDILVDIQKNISLLDFVALKLALEKKLKRSVDLVEYGAIKPSLKDYILKDHIEIL